MTEYVLDVSKWICGNQLTFPDGIKSLGYGCTEMLNEQGFMCCLGQFAEQKGVDKNYLLYQGNPADVFCKQGNYKSYDENFILDGENTELARELMQINDSQYSTIGYKIERIGLLLKKAGHSLKVINGDQYL